MVDYHPTIDSLDLERLGSRMMNFGHFSFPGFQDHVNTAGAGTIESQ